MVEYTYFSYLVFLTIYAQRNYGSQRIYLEGTRLLKNFTQNCATFLEKNAKMKKKMKCFF